MLDPSFAIKSKSTPDVLMELSIDAFNHFQGNTIHLSGITIEHDKISYQNVNYGSNVHKSIPKCCKGNNIWQEINLNRMVNNYVLVTVDKVELHKHHAFKDVITITHGYHENGSGSGKLLLLFARLQKKNKGMIWTKKHYDAVHECKDSVISKHNKHHQSSGEYFSFGNKGAYKTVDGSSVGQYATKKNSSIQQKSNVIIIEELIARELKQGIDILSSLQPAMSFKECISPVLNVAKKLQESIGDIKLKESSYSDYGIWKSVMCVNAETEEMHSEDDCSYTVITVPRQDAMKNKREYRFMFQLNNQECFAVRMNQPITFMFSGKFLLHKQSCSLHHPKGSDDLFINFGTYANKKLFNHIRCSFARIS